MSAELIQQQLVLWDGYNLTTRLNSVIVNASVDALDDTTLGCTNKSNAPGLKTFGIQVEGIYDTLNYDKILASTISGSDKLISVCRNNSEGSLAYFLNAVHANYEPIKGSVGELAGFSAGGVSRQSPLCRGTLLFNGSGLTSSDVSEPQSLGLVMPSQSIYAGVHVLAIDDNAGDTLDIEIETDLTGDFLGSETTRLTFDQMTDIGSQFKKVTPGAMSDVFYRVNYVIDGATPNFAVAVVVAIQSTV